MVRRSIHNLLILFGLLLALSAPVAAGTDVAAAEATIDAMTARAHVQFLADDKLEGRAAGSPGGRAAAAYIVRRLQGCGLEPGGTGEGEDAWFHEFTQGGVRCRNVVAIRRGRDPRRKGEHVVLGAHYDHLGHGESGGLPTLRGLLGGAPRGEIHNGADDNASGSAALLEVGKALAALDPGPARTVVLVWFDGEERGLWGSRHYVEEPRLPLASCVGMINMDEVGRARDGHVQVIGANSGKGLVELIEAENRAIGLQLEVDPYMVPNSDHFSFYTKGVPVAFFFTGLHTDYHRPSDDWQKINCTDMARVARLAFRTAARLADAPEPPVYAEVPIAPAGAMVLEFGYAFTGSDLLRDLQRGAYGGIAGAFLKSAAPLDGLEVEYVVPGSAAAAAGLRKGDRLLRLHGRPLEGAPGRVKLLVAAHRGGALALDVARGAERLKVTIAVEAEPPKGQRKKEAALF